MDLLGGEDSASTPHQYIQELRVTLPRVYHHEQGLELFYEQGCTAIAWDFCLGDPLPHTGTGSLFSFKAHLTLRAKGLAQ